MLSSLLSRGNETKAIGIQNPSKSPVRAGDVCVEYDKLIDRQLERASITTISGFAKICDDAANVLAI